MPDARGVDITVGARTLAAYTAGVASADPTVVCESGLGGDHHSWDAIAPALASRTQLVSYDRAAYGRSTPATDGRRLMALAGDLMAVCNAVAPDGRLVLVGHSLGGRIVRAATSRLDPTRIAGIVLVEGAPPDDFARTAPRVAKAQTWTMRSFGWAGAAGVFRIRAVQHKLAARLGESNLESESMKDMLGNTNRPAFWRAVQQEWASMTDTMPATPDVPAVELLGDGWKDWGRNQRLRFGADARELLQHIRTDFTNRYPGGRVETVPDTSHNIQRDHPDVVVEAILSLF